MYGILFPVYIILERLHILLKAVAYFCLIADNGFLNDPHNFVYSRILLMLIFVCASTVTLLVVATVLKHTLGGQKKFSNARKKKNSKKLGFENRL